MRIAIQDRPVSLTTLSTDLAAITDPNCELRSHKAGRLYAKSGARHAHGRSRSRLAYQAGGAEYLSRSVSQSLRERGVTHVVALCKSIMDAARPESERNADEPQRYRVRHARAMARILEAAQRPEAQPLGFESAVQMAATHWPVLSALDDTGARQWWGLAVRAQLATARKAELKAGDAKAHPRAASGPDDVLTPSSFDRKGPPAAPVRLQPPQPLSLAQKSAAQAQREAQTLWHNAPDVAPAERKHGPGGRSPKQVIVHPSPLKVAESTPERTTRQAAEAAAARAATRAQGFLDTLVRGDLAVDGLLAGLRPQDVPPLMPRLRQQADALLVSAATPRDAKAQARDRQAWSRLGQFCGEASIDDGAGAQAFTRRHVMQLPLNQRLNMLEALVDDVAQSQRPGRQGQAVQDPQATRVLLQQLHGLMSAFTDAELLPTSDEVRVKAMKAQLQAIAQRSPGAAWTPALAEEIVKAQQALYPARAKALDVKASATLAQPFVFSEDRATLYVSTAPRPAAEQTREVTHQLLIELARDYQRHLVREFSLERLKEPDDRYMLAVTLINCRPPAVDMELLGSGFDRALPASAPTRHAALHARLALGG